MYMYVNKPTVSCNIILCTMCNIQYNINICYFFSLHMYIHVLYMYIHVLYMSIICYVFS